MLKIFFLDCWDDAELISGWFGQIDSVKTQQKSKFLQITYLLKYPHYENTPKTAKTIFARLLRCCWVDIRSIWSDWLSKNSAKNEILSLNKAINGSTRTLNFQFTVLRIFFLDWWDAAELISGRFDQVYSVKSQQKTKFSLSIKLRMALPALWVFNLQCWKYFF